MVFGDPMNLDRTPTTAVAVLAASIAVTTIAAGVIFELVRLFNHAELFSGVSLSNDQHFYFPMAQAWLNGFSFYRDLFETKPPVIFLIAALSLKLTGDNSLLVVLQWALLACFGPVLAFFAYHRLEAIPKQLRLVVTAGTLLMGLVFAVQTIHRSLGYQPEGFALFFATLPALCLGWTVDTRRRWLTVLVGGAAIGVAAMIKEPFAASSLLAMLIVCRGRRNVVCLFQILIVGAITAATVLICSGAFGTYFAIYLPEIFSGRSINAFSYAHYGLQVQYIIPTPLWVRSLEGVRILAGLSQPVWNAGIPALICVCLAVWAPLRFQDTRPRSIVASTVLLAAAVVTAHQLFILLTLISGLSIAGQSIPWGNPILLRLGLMVLASPLAVVIGIWIIPRHFRPQWQVVALAAIAFFGFYAATSLVSFGGNFDSQYFVFVFPPAIVLAYDCIIEATNKRHWVLLAVLMLLSLAHTAIPNREDYPALASQLAGQIERSSTAIRQAKLVDALMTACSEARYLLADDKLLDIPAFTKHSPYQIEYGQVRSLGGFNINANQYPNAYLAAKLAQDLASARIIIASASYDLTARTIDTYLSKPVEVQRGVVAMGRDDSDGASAIPSTVATVIRDHFTKNMPPCAAPYLPIEGLQLFFRR